VQSELVPNRKSSTQLLLNTVIETINKMWKVRELADKVTNVVMNYTEIEAKVREATNDEAWGPTGTIKHELSQSTFSYDSFPEVMGMLWKRIAENKRSPRRIYKSLLLLHHLLLNGSDRVVRATQDRMYELRSLTEYHVVYDPGFTLNSIIPASGVETKDGELNVRVKAKEIVDLVQDEEKLREDRKKAKKNRDKYVGIGSDRMMTSKWTDDYGNYDDEKTSPPTKTKQKQFSDFDSDFPSNNSISSSNSFSRVKPAPPTPPLDFDFNPRADEKSEFGDFTSAAITVPKSISTPASTDTKGEFADFQSAFGDSKSANDVSTTSPTSSEAAISNNVQVDTNATDDLLGLSFDLGSSHKTTPAAFLPNSSGIPNLFASLPSQPSNFTPAGFASIPVSNTPAFVPQPFQAAPFAGESFQQQDLFSGNTVLTPVLQPASDSTSIGAPVNNSASNNINNNSNGAPSLKGTTWSDLNISLGDLNLRHNARHSSSAGNKTTINQMLQAPRATAAINNFGFPK